MEQEKNTLSVLQIAPGQHPKPIKIDNDLKAVDTAIREYYGFIGGKEENEKR